MDVCQIENSATGRSFVQRAVERWGVKPHLHKTTVGQKIRLQCTYFSSYFFFRLQYDQSEFSCTSIPLLLQIFPVASEAFITPRDELLFSLLVNSVSCVVSHLVTNVSTSRTSLNLCPLTLCFRAGSRCYPLSYELPWHNHNQCGVSRYEIIIFVLLRTLVTYSRPKYIFIAFNLPPIRNQFGY
jgi:hypothetical protein